VRVTKAARRINHRWNIDARLATVVLEEADRVLGGAQGFLLSIKNGILAANAGVDLKNAPPGTAMLWPLNADASARRLRKTLEKRFGVRIGVIVVDSRITPLRLGTVGLAIGVSGLAPVGDCRGIADIYGRKAKVTMMNLADDLASCASLLMGEASERIGVVIARNAPVQLLDSGNSRRACLSIPRCLIASNILGKKSRVS
jgi:coenzyme F420-0:L-glutamate ligase / coenzyme F420-1:gamma-L-glutamate ligase